MVPAIVKESVLAPGRELPMELIANSVRGSHPSLYLTTERIYVLYNYFYSLNITSSKLEQVLGKTINVAALFTCGKPAVAANAFI